MKLLRFRWGNDILEGTLIEEQQIASILRDRNGSEIGKQRMWLDGATLVAPVQPSKVVAVGMNYPIPGHDASGTAAGQTDVFSIKATTAIVGPDEPIVLPTWLGEVIAEIELGVVIGRKATRVGPGEALDYVQGYTIVNDVVARALYIREGRRLLTKSKSFDTFCPIGPVVETDLDPSELRLVARRNGEVVQDGNTKDMLVDVPQLISRISHVMTLLPGDVISTGTPLFEEVGKDLPSPLAIHPGDQLRLEIDGIGVLENPVVGGD